MISAGSLLVATPQISEGIFARSVVALIDHDAEGSVGVVLNKPTVERVADHVPLVGPGLMDDRIFRGGPVQPEVAVCLAIGPGPFSIEVPGKGLGLIDISQPPSEGHQWRVFSGYAGWTPGQLTNEIDEGGWWVVESVPKDFVGANPETLWQNVVRRQTGTIAMFEFYPTEARAN